MYQSNPFAITSIALLAAIFCYEFRATFVALFWAVLDLTRHLLVVALIAGLLIGLGYLLHWLGWRWLAVGIARTCGAMVILFVLFLLWTELLRPVAQKLSRRWTR